ncbi:lactate utilization protein [Candidatus Bathyarchaeota archaeon]|nr:lactate utilization protein [Candidatus Bathyarchaeota archaeon]
MMEDVKEWYVGKVVSRTLSSLDRNGFKAKRVADREEALQWLLSVIPAGARVGVGGSVTLREIGIVKALEQRGNAVYQHWKKGLSLQEREEIRKSQLTSDIFLTSSNAVTENGELVNIDGAGNRVASMIYGPGQTIVVVGVNKIVEDLEGGLNRARNVASPMNCKRLGRKTPCVKTGKCEDCDSPDRICRAVTIIERNPVRSNITVLLVEETLGF